MNLEPYFNYILRFLFDLNVICALTLMYSSYQIYEVKTKTIYMILPLTQLFMGSLDWQVTELREDNSMYRTVIRITNL